jgi:SAM-dependent methyltransferase
MIELPDLAVCVYCGGDAGLFEKGARHKYESDHGPFDLYQCKSCQSLFTYPAPSQQQIADLYMRFSKGMHEKITDLRTTFPLNAWFKQCFEHMMKDVNTRSGQFSWIDVGAGDGNMSALLNSQFPISRGVAADFHDTPVRLKNSNVQWVSLDLNEGLDRLGKADLVFAITVLEHIIDPRQFVTSMISCLNPGGVLYLNCPRTDSLAFRFLGKNWPYYLAGEHITVPSMKGLKTLMEKTCREKFGNAYKLEINSVLMPYPLGYYLGYFFNSKKTSLVINPDIYLPTGILECKLRLTDQD